MPKNIVPLDEQNWNVKGQFQETSPVAELLKPAYTAYLKRQTYARFKRKRLRIIKQVCERMNGLVIGNDYG